MLLEKKKEKMTRTPNLNFKAAWERWIMFLSTFLSNAYV